MEFLDIPPHDDPSGDQDAPSEHRQWPGSDAAATAPARVPGWSLDILKQSTIAWEVLERQAQRLESISAQDEAMGLRETLLIICPWGQADTTPKWSGSAARVETLIAMQAPLSAVIELLPSGSTYCARSLVQEPASGHVTLGNGATGQCKHAATPSLMLAAALFRALSAYVARN